MNINARIKKLRQSLNLSQDDFGKKLGVTRGAITNIELNKTEPKPLFINLICEVFNVNTNWLLNGEGDMFLSFSPYEKAYNRFGYIMENSSASKKAALSVLLELLYSVPDDTWDSIISQFDSLKNND